MSMQPGLIEPSAELRTAVANAIQQVRIQIRWKPGKDLSHLAKRIDRFHLPPGTTLDEYNAIIYALVTTPDALVYGFYFGSVVYPTVVAP